MHSICRHNLLFADPSSPSKILQYCPHLLQILPNNIIALHPFLNQNPANLLWVDLPSMPMKGLWRVCTWGKLRAGLQATQDTLCSCTIAPLDLADVGCLDSIAVSVFVAILVDFDIIWEEKACLVWVLKPLAVTMWVSVSCMHSLSSSRVVPKHQLDTCKSIAHINNVIG